VRVQTISLKSRRQKQSSASCLPSQPILRAPPGSRNHQSSPSCHRQTRTGVSLLACPTRACVSSLAEPGRRSLLVAIALLALWQPPSQAVRSTGLAAWHKNPLCCTILTPVLSGFCIRLLF
jgi:hypothetical protein